MSSLKVRQTDLHEASKEDQEVDSREKVMSIGMRVLEFCDFHACHTTEFTGHEAISKRLNSCASLRQPLTIYLGKSLNYSY